MIELIVAERCTACNICVRVCPVSVFEATPQGLPKIAHQQDCQSCFMCELYCPEDALYVAPQAEELTGVSAQSVDVKALLGSYRKSIGWGTRDERAAGMPTDASYELLKRAH
jgi:NAD-dependent dihydropyrimidine dehydrogenase PreA subunit